MTFIARRIQLSGIVQGVGFRPFVWRLAQELALGGWVRNDAQGVEVLVTGNADAVATLLLRLRSQAPALARIDQITVQDALYAPMHAFTIADSVASNGPGQASALPGAAIGPDVGVCPDCLAELFDPTNRRYRHAFITCTHCGPRFTVTRALPYDRPQTSLAPFPLCTACALEYAAPADRRFHAETTCCPACGPTLTLQDAQGAPLPGDPIAATLALLRAGAIVAIKGLGGFHLACDARHAQALARLRQRKNRGGKPFALMAANLASLAPWVQLDAPAAALLQARERAVLILNASRAAQAQLGALAPGLSQLGVMLPCTPIQHLLFHEAAARPAGCDWLHHAQPLLLVMTSANPGGEPIVRERDEALQRLAGIADVLLDHDRAVLARCDDSVLRMQGTAPLFVRRSRGYAPAAVRLARGGPCVLAFGAHQKNTVCVTRGDQAFVSPHIGDLDNAATCAFQDETVGRMLDLLQATPLLVAHDLHPDDYSTRAALAFAARHGLPTLAVQHHHAHIAAVCAEHGHCGDVLGLALDGFGLGADGQAWGGELLHIAGRHCQRLGHLRPLPMPGGDRAAREPWRLAAGALHSLGRGGEIGQRFTLPGTGIVAAMLARALNCPHSTSMGRTFDAAAALLGLCTHMQFEAQAAMLLEQAAASHILTHGWPPASAAHWHLGAAGELDLLPLLGAMADASDAAHGAALFHASLLAGLTQWVVRAAQATGVRTLAWGGGCFLNTLLAQGLRQNLEHAGLVLLTPQRLSPGDASIAIGQAWVAIQSTEH